ncbi:MAG: hypothetical protein JWM39_63 [Parcubacteria group bacterium]|nr:hypothetical protein [Parcubacteria group bacterium]
MKGLLSGIIIVVLIAFGAFVYRGVKERPVALTPQGSQKACTQEAKVCPDGTSVGRTGPDCAFAACAAPNTADVSLGIVYVVPTGFGASAALLAADPTLRDAYASNVASGTPDSITITSFPIPAGKTANNVILSNTVHESSGIAAKAMNEFTPVLTNGKTFQSITVERFEGIVHTEYYLARTNDVLRFDVTEHNVANWSDSKLLISNLPSHQALLKTLSTLQSTN